MADEPWVVLYSVSQQCFHVEELSVWRKTGPSGGGYNFVTQVSGDIAASRAVWFLEAFRNLTDDPQAYFDAMVEACKRIKEYE